MNNPDLLEGSLPRKLRMALIAWRAGTDLRSMYANRTWYRMRRELLDAVGVDIASPFVATQETVGTGAALDEKGWDPEPLKAHVHEPDPKLRLEYGV